MELKKKKSNGHVLVINKFIFYYITISLLLFHLWMIMCGQFKIDDIWDTFGRCNNKDVTFNIKQKNEENPNPMMGQNWRPTTIPGEYNIFFLAYQRKLNGSKSFFQYVQTAHYIGQALNTTTITKSQYLYFLFLYKKKYLYF